MRKADTCLIGQAEEDSVSAGAVKGAEGQPGRGFRPARGEGGHIPGDTRTPPAPGAIRIGPEDV